MALGVGWGVEGWRRAGERWWLGEKRGGGWGGFVGTKDYLRGGGIGDGSWGRAGRLHCGWVVRCFEKVGF
jgi:hypothetical protein